MSEVIRLMEVCGTHTMAIAKAGFRSILPERIRLVSGPGCPVCVTPPEVIDAVLALADEPGVLIATYGDMIRVPGSKKGDTLRKHAADGADVRIVYSAMDALSLARENPEKEIVFLGVGFETTTPGTAAAIEAAADADLRNFSVYSMLKRLEPSIRALAADPDFNIQGFLCPGHVAVILGEEGLRFFSEDLGFPAVIAGFETGEIADAITRLIKQIRAGKARLENAYTSVVRPEGNPLALEAIARVLTPRRDIWRGLGVIEESGYGIRETYANFDAERRFDIHVGDPIPTACRCGDVIRGKIDPAGCPMFGTVCTPEAPDGPCMVSSEGACAAAYRYRTI